MNTSKASTLFRLLAALMLAAGLTGPASMAFGNAALRLHPALAQIAASAPS
jgi:hypothetical protein